MVEGTVAVEGSAVAEGTAVYERPAAHAARSACSHYRPRTGPSEASVTHRRHPATAPTHPPSSAVPAAPTTAAVAAPTSVTAAAPVSATAALRECRWRGTEQQDRTASSHQHS